MKKPLPLLLAALAVAVPASVHAQRAWSLNEATYITSEQIDEVNALPGVDRQIVSRNIGELNLSVGIIKRGATSGSMPTGNEEFGERPCGVSAGTPSGARGIEHYHQTETYVIWSGAGTLVTGGQILYGGETADDANVTTVLNGKSCSGFIVGDVKKIDVKEGDVVIIPAGVPHGWANIPDHVEYLSVRPDPDRVLADDYQNPAVTLR
ncbi:MAG: cupin domain-containing protein [Gemmatimonadota bacterium]|jgi:quercetin dioxygenase-like cupin family protein